MINTGPSKGPSWNTVLKLFNCCTVLGGKFKTKLLKWMINRSNTLGEEKNSSYLYNVSTSQIISQISLSLFRRLLGHIQSMSSVLL